MKLKTSSVSWRRAIAVWLMLMIAESMHGVLRGVVLVPVVGDFLARQISVLTGSLLIVGIAWLFIRWIRAKGPGQLWLVGLVWLGLTLLFEIGLGRIVLHYSWARILSDYDTLHGGLLPFGLVVLTCSPLIAARLRAIQPKPIHAITK
jgi:hypothetical protein